MPTKKIAIYVEGQTDQIFLNRLILTWWSYSDIEIENFKLVQNLKNPVPNFNSPNPLIQFVIINVEGLGSLPSAIAERAISQIEKGFHLIALRDLDTTSSHSTDDRIIIEAMKFKEALQLKGLKDHRKIELFFAVTKIETWLLAFYEALSKWTGVPQIDVLKQIKEKIPNLNFEDLRSPGDVIKTIGKTDKDLKNFSEVMSLVSHIEITEIHRVREGNHVPNFSRFWNNLVLCTQNF